MREAPARPEELPSPPPTPSPRRSPAMRRFRVDRGSDSGDDLAPGRGSLLRAFAKLASSKPSPIAEHRRSEPRGNAVECLAWVGWKVWRDFKMNDALVVNLSRSGAQIFVDRTVPGDRPVWLFLETPREKTIVKARVVELRATSAGQYMAHVGFLEPCTCAFFEAAV
jgi:hypothetical protein